MPQGHFQLGFAALHAYAACLALLAVVLHSGAAVYHWRRRQGAANDGRDFLMSVLGMVWR